jgi:hypothetical protein
MVTDPILCQRLPVAVHRNLISELGHHMDQVFKALIARSPAPLDLKTIRTILGYRRRRGIGPAIKESAQ